MRRYTFYLLIILIVILGVYLYLCPPYFLPKVKVSEDRQGEFHLLVERYPFIFKPFIIKGTCYNPTPIGEGYNYEFWSNSLAPWRIDAVLLEDMGANTIRVYKAAENPQDTKDVIKYFCENHGVRTMLGHWLGYWEYPFPGYADQDFREKIKKSVLKMVREYKDTPGLLMWVLGNENNKSFGLSPEPFWTTPEIEKLETLAEKNRAKARIYYSFVDELAGQIKELDPNHPVAFSNAGLAGLGVASSMMKNVDIVALTIYRGKTLSSVFKAVHELMELPVVIIEFGCPRFDDVKSEEVQDIQADFIVSQWQDIQKNLASGTGFGNALGGVVFEWTDEWWKYNSYDIKSWYYHNTEPSWSSGGYYFDIQAKDNLNMNEEWWGIVSISPGEDSLDIRIPTQAYYELKRIWQNLYK